METFIDQVWVTLMSAFVVLGFFLGSMVCSIWRVKVFFKAQAERAQR